MTLRFEKTFGLITVQDAGRPGQRSAGLPLGGPADSEAARLANRLVGNADRVPLLEFAMATATFTLDRACAIAWTGQGADLYINGNLQTRARTLHCFAKDTCTIRGQALGRYGYLAVAGDWDLPRWRGSASPIMLGTDFVPSKNVIRTGSRLEITEALQLPFVQTGQQFQVVPHLLLGLSPAPESADLTGGKECYRSGSKDSALLSGAIFKVDPNSNRVGIRLRSTSDTKLTPLQDELGRSSPTVLGSVQVLPQGHLIVNHVDGPTMGGYPRVGVVDRPQLNRLAQHRGSVSFYWVDWPGAV